MKQKNKYILAINKDMTHTMLVVPLKKVGEVVEKSEEADLIFVGKNKKSIEKVFNILAEEKVDEMNRKRLEAAA